jgi:hypothetical protein
VYLDVDQSKASNLNRRFYVTLKDMLRSVEVQLDKSYLQSFSADAARVQKFVSGFEPGGKGLIIFCDDPQNFFWSREVNASIQNDARWADTAYIRPLLEVLDEYERYSIVLVDALAPGDLLVLYSDGVAEAGNAQDQEFGETRLLDRLRVHANLPAPALLDAVVAAMQEFSGAEQQQDDITVVVACGR